MNCTFGISYADSTPDHPCYLSAFARKQPSTSVLDHLRVSAIASEWNNTPLILIVIDSLMVAEDFANEVRARVAARTGVPAENISVSAIHTHSAPVYFAHAFEDTPVEAELTDQLCQQAVDTAASAWETRRPATCTLERMEVEGLYGNRNVPEGPSDKSCSVLTFTDAAGTVAGKVLNISTHPTILGSKNLAISADLIGQLRIRLEQAWGCPVVCTNGTCGDVSTRFYRQGEGVDELMRTADELSRQIVEKLRPVELVGDEMTTGTLRMPVTFDATTDPDCLQMVAAATADPENPRSGWVLRRIERKRAMSPVHLTLVSHYAVLGNLILITLPGDICSALGLRLKAAFPEHAVINIGYANAYCNYLVPNEDYGKYFETMNARTARGQADRFIERIIGTIKAAM